MPSKLQQAIAYRFQLPPISRLLSLQNQCITCFVGAGSAGGGPSGGSSLGGRTSAAAVLAPEEARVTGEEAERAAFSGEGVLYEFSAEVRAFFALGLVKLGMHGLGGLGYL